MKRYYIGVFLAALLIATCSHRKSQKGPFTVSSQLPDVTRSRHVGVNGKEYFALARGKSETGPFLIVFTDAEEMRKANGGALGLREDRIFHFAGAEHEVAFGRIYHFDCKGKVMLGSKALSMEWSETGLDNALKAYLAIPETAK